MGLLVGVVPPAVAESSSFADVGVSASFFTYIQWMASSGISTGTVQPSGLPLYKPSDAVSRQAMAAFLLRLSGDTFTAPLKATFADMDSSNPFYAAVEWMAVHGISTGTVQSSGKPLFKPTDPVSRQAMALFLARYDHADVSAAPDNQSFADVPVGSAPAAAIGWMASSGISTGTAQASGLPVYAPLSAVSRQAMAAFLYRLAHQSLAAPLLETVTAEGLGVQVTWAPNPVTDQVTSYSVVATPSSGSSAPSCSSPAPVTVTVPVSNSSVVVAGLCAGVVYTAQVTAVTAAGSSPPSAASAPVVPLVAQAPDAPLLALVTPRDGSLQVAWSSPVYDGGEPVTGYSLTATAGSATQTVLAGPGSSSATVTGLMNGTKYSLSLVAVTAVGSSTASVADGTPTAAYVPSVPLGFTTTPDGVGNVALSWQTPADDGGAAVTGYVVSYQQVTQGSGGIWSPVAGATIHTLNATATIATVTTFETRNAFYQFTILASNSVGPGTVATAANPVSPAVDIPAGTIVLTTSTVNALTAVTPTTLVWTDPAPIQIQNLVAGNVIVAPAVGLLPEGALRSVASIADTGTVLTLTTTNAALTQAFANLSVSSTVNPATGTSGTTPKATSTKTPLNSTTTTPTPTAPGTFHPAIAGVKLIASNFGGSVTLSNSITLAVSIPGVKGELNLTPSVGVGLEVHQNFIGVPDGVSVTSKAKVVAKAKLTVGLVGDHKFLLGDLAGAPEDIQVGPVPVIVVPKIPIFLTISGSASLGISVSVTLGASMSWSSQNPSTLTTQNLTSGPEVSAGPLANGGQGTVSVSGSVGLSVQPQADIYGIGGPDFEADLNFTGTINFNPPTGVPFLTLGPELILKAGLALDAFGVHGDLNGTIAKLSFQAYVIQTPPGPGLYTISPSNGNASVGVPLTLTAARSDGGTSPLTWGLLGATTGDSITPSGLLTVAAPSGRTLTVTVGDSTGVAGQTTLTIGDLFTAPANPTVTQTSGQPFTAALHWNPPTATGGNLIAYYRVVTQPDTGTHTTTAQGLTLTGLKAGTYLANVYAINTTGQTSNAAATTTININSDGSLNTSITGATPRTLPVTGGTLTLTGIGFTAATDVSLDGKSVAFTVVNDSQLSAELPAGPPTAHTLTVTGPGGSDTFAISYTGSNSPVLTDIGSSPYGIAVDSSTHRVYVSLWGSNQLKVIDGISLATIATIPVGTHPFGVAVDPGLHRAYVVNIDDHTVTLIDTQTNSVVGSPVPTGNAPYQVAVDTSTHRVFVNNEASQSITNFDGMTLSAGTPFATGGRPFDVAVDSTTHTLYVTNNDGNTVWALNDASGSLIQSFVVGDHPFGVDVDPATHKVYVTNNFDKTMSVIHGTSVSVVTLNSTSMPFAPEGVAIDSSRGLIFVAGHDFPSIPMINATGSGYSGILSTGGINPDEIAVDSVTHRVFATDFGGTSLLSFDSWPTPP